MVNIILDGENCWEYYPNSGLEFLRGLYRRVVQHPRIKPVRVGDYLARYPAGDKLGNLFPGSWIQHNFGIWIGHPECNSAWDLLFETRRHLAEVDREKKQARRKKSPGRGKNSISPRAAIGFGGSATLILGAGRAVRPVVPQTHAERVPCARRSPARRTGQTHRPRTTPPQLYSDPTGLSARENRRPANVFRMDQRRALCLRRIAGHDEHGHAGIDFGFVLRIRPGAVAASVRFPGRSIPRTIDTRSTPCECGSSALTVLSCR